MRRAVVLAVVVSWLVMAPGVRAQSHGFGSRPSVAPTAVRTPPTTLRLTPLTATTAAPSIGVVRITAGLGDANPNGNSFRPSISADGRYVAFASNASNLVEGDTNDQADIFVYDRATGQTTRENLGPGGAQANDDSSIDAHAISASGRFLAFDTSATNLLPGTAPSGRHLYVRDRQLGVTTLVDVSLGGADGWAMSDDGRYVAFSSYGWDITRCPEIFIRDMFTATTERAIDAEPCRYSGGRWALSGDGRYVAFESLRTNQLPTGVLTGVFVRDRLTGITTLESVGSDGAPLSDLASSPSLSADGRFMSFRVHRTGNNLIYFRDRFAGRTTGPVAAAADVTHLSADGRFLSFANSVHQAYAVDLSSGAFIPVANEVDEITAVAGNAIAFSSNVPQLATDTGRVYRIYVASEAAALAPGAPVNLGSSLFGSTLTLTWSPPVNGGTPTAYVIEAGSTNGATDVANFSTGSIATGFSATVSGGGTFFIRVRATNADGTSAPSNQIFVTIGSSVTPPGPPVGLSATVVLGSAVDLRWAPPLSGGTASTFIIQAGSSPGASDLATINTGDASNTLEREAGRYFTGGVAPGTYYVRVLASNAAGVGPPSNEVIVVVR